MKKGTKIFIVFAIILVLLIPVPNRLKDGGSVEYKALLYKYTKVHRLNEKSANGYEDGAIFELFGMEIYNETNYEPKKDDNKKIEDNTNKEENKEEEKTTEIEEDKKEETTNEEEKEIKVDSKYLNNIKEEIISKISQLDNYDNLASIYLDIDNLKVVVVLMDNSEEKIEWFKKNIKDSEYITFDSEEEEEILG